MRADLDIIQDWIPAGSRVLDLGCGNGELLAWLREHKQVSGYGLEIDPDNIARCIERGVNVIEQDLDKGLGNFASNSFDVVLMTQALQAVDRPDQVLREVRQVLTDENFARVREGMSRDQVRRLLGQPAHELFFALKQETVWDWKTIAVANTPAYFNVHFGADGRVVRTSSNFADSP